MWIFLLIAAKMVLSEDKWLEVLGKERYQVMRNKQTEKAFLGQYVSTTGEGTYVCAACENRLFSSEDKLFLGAGWPMFSKPISKKCVYYLEERLHGLKRYEVLCRECDSHLGHVFKENSKTPMRYTINSIALKLLKAQSQSSDKSSTSRD